MKSRIHQLSRVLLIGLVIVVLTISPTAAQEEEAEAAIQGQLQQYAQAFRTADMDSFKQLYWQDPGLTIFWPGQDGLLRIDGWDQWEAYLPNLFGFMAQLPSGGFNLHIRHPDILVMQDTAVATGYGLFLGFPDEAGGTTTLFFRATWVFQEQEDGQWLIVHEHIDEFKAEF